MPAPHRAGMDIKYTGNVSRSQHVAYPLVMTRQLPFLPAYSLRSVIAAKPVEKHCAVRRISEDSLPDNVILTLIGKHLPSPLVKNHYRIIFKPDYRIYHFSTTFY